MDPKIVWTILHLFGVAFGVGGAFLSDFLFLSSVKDGRLSEAEIRLLRVASRTVWIGVIILLISGLGLFSLDTAKYLASSKFLAKMTIVAVIILNGLAFHYRHIPMLAKHSDYFSSDEFSRHRWKLLLSGAVSAVSWSFALILGALHKVTYAYWEIILVYLIVLVVAVLIGFLVKNRVFPKGY